MILRQYIRFIKLGLDFDLIRAWSLENEFFKACMYQKLNLDLISDD